MGIHTGQATPVEGVYTGLAVHRAARICAAARGGQILISQATQTLIEDEEEELAFELVELGERRLKDLVRPVRLFELTVVEAVPEPPPQRSVPALALPSIVGRAAELRIISTAYARAVSGQSQVMLITGAAGIGKTRLVEELTGHARSAADGARVRVGESAPITGTTLAYGPFVAALGHEAEWLLADDPADNMLTARHRLFVRVLSAVPRGPFRRGGRGRARGPKRRGRYGGAAGHHHRDRQQCRGSAPGQRPVGGGRSAARRAGGRIDHELHPLSTAPAAGASGRPRGQ
jgi:hypothetical protein